MAPFIARASPMQRCLLPIVVSALASAAYGSQCFREGLSYTSHAAAPQRFAYSKEDCLANCRKLTKCTRFTYFSDTHSCWLLGPGALEEPAVSGVSGVVADCQGVDDLSGDTTSAKAVAQPQVLSTLPPPAAPAVPTPAIVTPAPVAPLTLAPVEVTQAPTEAPKAVTGAPSEGTAGTTRPVPPPAVPGSVFPEERIQATGEKQGSGGLFGCSWRDIGLISAAAAVVVFGMWRKGCGREERARKATRGVRMQGDEESIDFEGSYDQEDPHYPDDMTYSYTDASQLGSQLSAFPSDRALTPIPRMPTPLPPPPARRQGFQPGAYQGMPPRR